MTDAEFRELLAARAERRGLEFKGPGLRSDRPLFAKVVRAMLGMANRRGGGHVILGVDDRNGVLTLVGLDEEQLTSWRYDDVAAGLAPYADPYVEFALEQHDADGMRFVRLTVTEFRESPVLCRRDYPDVLRDGACYVRSFRKPETSAMPSSAEMRELLDLAIEKRLRGTLNTLNAAGLIQFVAAPGQLEPNDEERFAREREEF